MKRLVLLLGLIFVVVLAIVVGNRMSADAIAVVVGVTCGVLASIPTSLLVIWATNRRGDSGSYRDRQAPAMGMGSQYPPVVVVNAGESYSRPSAGSSPYWLEQEQIQSMAARDFRVVGDPDSVSEWASPKWARSG